MKKQHLRAAALLLAAAMTAGAGTTAFAAEDAPTGPGLEIEAGRISRTPRLRQREIPRQGTMERLPLLPT